MVISRAWGFQIVAKAKSADALGGEIMLCPAPPPPSSYIHRV